MSVVCLLSVVASERPDGRTDPAQIRRAALVRPSARLRGVKILVRGPPGGVYLVTKTKKWHFRAEGGPESKFAIKEKFSGAAKYIVLRGPRSQNFIVGAQKAKNRVFGPPENPKISEKPQFWGTRRPLIKKLHKITNLREVKAHPLSYLRF